MVTTDKVKARYTENIKNIEFDYVLREFKTNNTLDIAEISKITESEIDILEYFLSLLFYCFC